MSEFSFPSTSAKKTRFPNLFSDFFTLCSFILSHPLYFSYFIFFSPYLLKLLSFLSPLFITTSLLLITLLTVSPNLPIEFPDSKLGFFLTTYHSLLENLKSNADDENEDFQHFEGLEVYQIVFETSTFDVRENGGEALNSSHGGNCIGVFEDLTSNLDETPVEITRPEVTQPIVGGKTLEGFLDKKNEYETLSCRKEDTEVKPSSVESNKVEEQKEMWMRSGSKAMCNKISEANAGECTYKVMENSTKLDANLESVDNGEECGSEVFPNSPTLISNLGSYGSMRKEKEWKRTLACKLFEERRNVDGGEGMDLLWETYESDSIMVKAKSNTKGKKGKVENYEDDEEDEEEVVDEQLCCLQALKFSAGKMNLGMGRPNLVKISKALKGIGWLHHVRRLGKKAYH